MKKTPVALFTYNRPSHTQHALKALSKCRRNEDCDYYFFSDGPQTDASRSEVEATRKILHGWAGGLKAQVIERPHNLGLAESIVTGVSDLCRQYRRVIVLEDDLIVDPDFLHYMIESLDHYENEAQVMQVGGCTLSQPPGISTDAFLLPVSTTWGWATWQRAWESFSWTPFDLAEAKCDEHWCRLFDLGGACAYSSMLEDRLAGRNNSWGILWWYAVSRRKGLVVYPRQRLVWNDGFDGSGTHCGSTDFFEQKFSSPQIFANLENSLTFPSVVQFDPIHLSHLEEFLRSKMAGGRSGGDRTMTCKTVIKKLKEKFYNAIF